MLSSQPSSLSITIAEGGESMGVEPQGSTSISGRIEDLLGQLTLEEKVSLLAGADTWRTVAVERLGIPSLKMSDGPNGARGGAFSGGVTAAAFPAGTVLASSWNTALVEQIGRASCRERV